MVLKFLTLLFFFLIFGYYGLSASIIKVPADYSTIDSALTAASTEDTILVDRGTYFQNTLYINKKIVLASKFIISRDEADIKNTIIQAKSTSPKQWIQLKADSIHITGFEIKGNREHSLGIFVPYASVTHCRFIGGKDQLSFEEAGGYVAFCYFEGALDDAIDADESLSWTIEHCTIVDAGQDGMEVRLHDKSGNMTTHIFRYNRVIGSGESGIQFINYPGHSQREFEVYGNIFEDCAGAAVSCMYYGKTEEDYKGSKMEERAVIYSNTIVGCNYAVTGAPNLIILNNIISGCKAKAIGASVYITSQQDNSVIDYCDFYNNPVDYDASLHLGDNILNFDPEFANWGTFNLKENSPCIDAGTVFYKWKDDTVINLKTKNFIGSAPDLGAIEYDPAQNIFDKDIVPR